MLFGQETKIRECAQDGFRSERAVHGQELHRRLALVDRLVEDGRRDVDQIARLDHKELRLTAVFFQVRFDHLLTFAGQNEQNLF